MLKLKCCQVSLTEHRCKLVIAFKTFCSLLMPLKYNFRVILFLSFKISYMYLLALLIFCSKQYKNYKYALHIL